MAGIKVSDIIYQKALKATIDAVKRGVEGERAINAGINVIRGSSWFQHQDEVGQKEVESSFRSSMQSEFGLVSAGKTTSTPLPKAKLEAKDYNKTEVIDLPKDLKKPTEVVTPISAVKKERPKPVHVERKPIPERKVPTKPAPEKIRPIKETAKTSISSPAGPVEAPKKKRGMGLGTFIVSLVFLGFLAYLSWVLYNHEVSVDNIVVYENEKLTFKESFPAEKILIMGQEFEMNYAISRKTSPLKVFRPKSSFPYWERVQDIECNSCDYWTNVENYDLHHYPDEKK